ncbi:MULTISPECIES: substrate-binding domain-containing protein [unclassified Streptomyces]|uniref:sugar ABC transporter substrate-binding protein n=1 Tax=unclassified Streptomyces TaxID=2593676 RepID=UPI002E11C459|nr:MULTISPECIES: substrate-binding domain-containing protein [unclassified Streptomyces]WSR24197.1 substrate-binding domain-containing protein [Streptomyces sp. NBC_01205]
MNTHLGRAVVAVAASAITVSLAACGSSEDSDGRPSGSAKEAIKVGLLLPENQTARYEKFDKPLIEKQVAKFTRGKGEVVYANAKQDAGAQNAQVEAMITRKVDVLIIDAVDAKAIGGAVKKAKDAKIPVIAYDRLAEGPIDAYTSFDNEDVGKVQGKALVEALGDKANAGQIVMMNGSVTDPNAKQFKSGAHSVLDGKVTVGKEYDTVDWKPENANTNMAAALSALGKGKIVGVYSANDGMAGGIITALKAAGVSPLPPVTGQDAELAGVQRIVSGEQYMSVYKQYAPEAAAAAEMAVALAQGEKIDGLINQIVDSPTTKGVPSVLVPGVALTRNNVKSTVVEDGVYTIAEICTDRYRAACEEIGLK